MTQQPPKLAPQRSTPLMITLSVYKETSIFARGCPLCPLCLPIYLYQSYFHRNLHCRYKDKTEIDFCGMIDEISNLKYPT